jgi:opacity protein-like surface antigen
MRVALAAVVLVSWTAAALAADAVVLEHKGRWESGYGSTWYNVVGRLKNTSGHALRWVKLRIDAVDAGGKVVASTDTYNESAEVLTVPEANPQDLLAKGKVKPLAADAEERFRGSFLKDETPAFTDYRVTIVETPSAK